MPGAIQLDQIDVQGAGNPNSTMTAMPEYAGGQVATGGQVGLLGNRSVMDTPFNQTSYTQKTIQNQQALTVNDVLTNDPSVIVGSPPSSGQDYLTIRGFWTRASQGSFGGLPGILPTMPIDAGMAERVEVLKGPSALLNGMPLLNDTIGGSINLVPKRAHDEPLTQLTTSYMSRANLGTHIDIGRRYGANKEFGVRFNGSYRNGEGAVDSNRRELGLAHLALDYRGERVRFSADLGYQKSNTTGITQPLFIFGNTLSIPRPPDASKNFMQPWTYSNGTDQFGLIQGEVDLVDNVTAYAAIGARRHDNAFVAADAVLKDAFGNFDSYPSRGTNSYNVLSWQTGVRASVDTGPIHHALSLNFTQSSQEQSYANAPYIPAADFVSNLYNPPFIPNPNLPDPGPQAKGGTLSRSSIGIADTLSILDKRIQFTVGVRRQQAGSVSFNTTTGAQIASYDSYAWSPAYALVVKPWENVSLYANYIEGLQQGQIVGTNYANAGEVFPPYQTKQYEAGIKIDWGRLTTTVSAFQIGKPNTIVIPGTPLPTLALNGEQVNRGIEFNVFGELTESIRLMGGVTLLDARLTKTQNGLYDGNKAPGVPDVNFVLGGEWDTPFVRGLTLTGRLNYLDSAFFEQANIRTVPAATRLDLGARYTFNAPWNNKPVTIRFNVENVFDKNYWLPTSYSSNYVELAPPRTYYLSTTFNF